MIVEFRAAVAHHLGGSPWPVHHFLPDDVGAVPCIAVPRPRLLPGDATLTNGQLVVWVVGRRLGDDDSQAELDEVTDAVVGRFGGLAHSVRLESPELQRLRLIDVTPTTVMVAGADYPAYALTVEAVFTIC